MNTLFSKLNFRTIKEESFAKLGGVFAQLVDITNSWLYRRENGKKQRSIPLEAPSLKDAMTILFSKLNFRTIKEESFAKLGGVFAQLGDITNGWLYCRENGK